MIESTDEIADPNSVSTQVHISLDTMLLRATHPNSCNVDLGTNCILRITGTQMMYS